MGTTKSDGDVLVDHGAGPSGGQMNVPLDMSASQYVGMSLTSAEEQFLDAGMEQVCHEINSQRGLGADLLDEIMILCGLVEKNDATPVGGSEGMCW